MLKNAVDIEGLSPLHEAAIGGNIHSIKVELVELKCFIII